MNAGSEDLTNVATISVDTENKVGDYIVMNTTDARTAYGTGTSDTMTWIIWRSAVESVAGASHDKSEAHVTKLALWFDAGEPVWMAADSLRFLVRESEKAAVVSTDRDIIRRAAAGGRSW